jgi:diadenosine tetraphosphate (Ap4A) HIT family hydrolase
MDILEQQNQFILNSQLEKDTFFLGNLKLSKILLMNDCRYPWIIAVPQIENITDITELSAKDRFIFMEEVHNIADLMKKLYQPDRINIAMLGNIVSQLHCHIIARFEQDFAWSKPVWGLGDAVSYSIEQKEKVIPLLQSVLLK